MDSDGKKLTITEGYSKNFLDTLKIKGLEFKNNEIMEGYMSNIIKTKGLWAAGVEQELGCVLGY